MAKRRKTEQMLDGLLDYILEETNESYDSYLRASHDVTEINDVNSKKQALYDQKKLQNSVVQYKPDLLTNDQRSRLNGQKQGVLQQQEQAKRVLQERPDLTDSYKALRAHPELQHLSDQDISDIVRNKKANEWINNADAMAKARKDGIVGKSVMPTNEEPWAKQVNTNQLFDDLRERQVDRVRTAHETEIENSSPEAMKRRKLAEKLAEGAAKGEEGKATIEYLNSQNRPTSRTGNAGNLEVEGKTGAKGKIGRYGRSALGLGVMLVAGSAITGLMMGSNKGRLNNSQMYGQQPYTQY